MKGFVRVPSLLFFVFLCGNALAQDAEPPDSTPEIHRIALPTQPILELLEKVEAKSGRTFLIESHVPSEVVTGTSDVREWDYPGLLAVLHNNGVGAVTVGEFTNIVPLHAIRMYDLPLLLEDDDSIEDLEWVTRIVALKHANAKDLIPVLRPLFIRAGHLAAINQSNSMLIVERNGNARRIARIVRELDKSASGQDE